MNNRADARRDAQSPANRRFKEKQQLLTKTYLFMHR